MRYDARYAICDMRYAIWRGNGATGGQHVVPVKSWKFKTGNENEKGEKRMKRKVEREARKGGGV
jgi:hypothetical protein